MTVGGSAAAAGTVGARTAVPLPTVTWKTLIPSARRATCPLARAAADPAAFDQVYDRYAQRVLLFFTRRVLDVDTAMDLTAETFAEVLAKREQFRGVTDEEEAGWVFAIARSQVSRYWRRGEVEREAVRRFSVQVPQISDAEAERVETLAGIHQLKPVLAEALGALPPDQRRAVELRVVEELGYGEIASTLAVSEDVVRARVSRGLRAMAQLLERRGISLETAA
jgi:RNA polymerase sigma-70 factor (ECF subfamily)